MAYRRLSGPPTVIALGTTIGVVIALTDMPYGYYSVLRLAVCGSSLFLLFSSHAIRVEWQRWLLGATAILYNPVMPVRIGDKDIWIILNLATIALFWSIAFNKANRK